MPGDPVISSRAEGSRKPTVLERAGSAAAGVGTLSPKRPRARAAGQTALVVLILAFLIGFIATQWNRLPDFDWRFRAGWLAAAAAAVAVFYVVQGELWRFILRELGAELDGRRARAVWGKSLVARYVPTNVLMLVGRIVMAERYGVPKRVCLASMVYELGLAVCTAVMVGSYFVITLPTLAGQPARFAILAVIPAALAALHPRVFKPVADYVLRKLGREPLPAPLPARRVALLIPLYIAAWAAIGAGLFAFAAGLYRIELGDLHYAVAAYPVAFCVAVLTFVVPGGLGTREAALATTLTVALPLTVATAIAVAFRLFQTAIELAYVGVAAALGRRAPAA